MSLEQPSKHSLAANVEELEPKPGQEQHQHHCGKRKDEPRPKVDHVAILREESDRKQLEEQVRLSVFGVTFFFL